MSILSRQFQTLLVAYFILYFTSISTTSDVYPNDIFSEILNKYSADNSTISEGDLNSMIDDLSTRTYCGYHDDDPTTNCGSQCINASVLFDLADVDSALSTIDDIAHFSVVSVVMVYLLTDFPVSCQDVSNGSYSNASEIYTQMLTDLGSHGDGLLSQYDLDKILNEIDSSYKVEDYGECIRSDDLFSTVLATSTSINYTTYTQIAMYIVYAALEGYCIGNTTMVSQEYFLDDLFETYADDDNEISDSKFLQMYVDLGLNDTEVEADSDHDDHRRRRRDVSGLLSVMSYVNTDRRLVSRVTRDTDENECYSGEQLLQIFSIDDITPLTEDKFLTLCPALIQQLLLDDCHSEEDTEEDGDWTKGEMYAYGTLTVFLISLLALVGVFLVPIMQTAVYEYMMQFCIALAVATLSGDALLHLLPQALGLHEHSSDETDDTSLQSLLSDRSYLWKCTAVIGAIYVFYVFEMIMHYAFISPNQCESSGHSHALEKPDSACPPDHHHHHDDHEMSEAAQISSANSKQTLTQNKTEVISTKNVLFAGCTTLVMMVQIGDSIHNLSDGLAIGAAFTADFKGGISTSLAVLCHELPHEISDFAIFLASGMSYKKALFLNFLSALTAFVGLYIGISVSIDIQARYWIFACIAGMFIYLAFVDMLPELRGHKAKSRVLTFLLQNLGLLCGWTSMLLIALFEDRITIPGA